MSAEFCRNGGTNGCEYHVNTHTYTTKKCKVVMSQIAAMQAQADSSTKQNHKPFKRQKTKYNFHVLLTKVEKIKESLERAMKQRDAAIRKRKREKRAEEQETSNKNIEPDSFALELEQLSISDDDEEINEADLEDLEETENVEQDIGNKEVKLSKFKSPIDDLLNFSLNRMTSVRAQSENPAKRPKEIHLAPITFGRLQTTLGKPKTTGIKILLDSGSTQTHIKKECVKKLRLKRDATAVWNTAAGPVSTNEKCTIQFMLPEFSTSKVIEWEVHVGTLLNVSYDMIIGNDLFKRLKIDVKYSSVTIEWMA